MTDPNDQNLALPEGDDELELESGDDTAQLQSGDDLARRALGQAQQNLRSMPGATDPAAQQQIAATLSSLQNVIERNAEQLDEIKAKMREYREELKNIFDNDQGLTEVAEQATQAAQKVKERKSQIQGSPQITQIKSNITELQEQKKEVEEALNNHLLNLYQMTGVKTFDTSSGQTREFDVRASIKSAKSPTP